MYFHMMQVVTWSLWRELVSYMYIIVTRHELMSVADLYRLILLYVPVCVCVCVCVRVCVRACACVR